MKIPPEVSSVPNYSLAVLLSQEKFDIFFNLC